MENRGVVAVVVRNLKGLEGNSHVNEKANVWQIDVCWAIFNNETWESTLDKLAFLGSSLSYISLC